MMSARNCIISTSLERLAGALSTLLKDKLIRERKSKVKNDSKRRKEGSPEAELVGIVSVMLVKLQLAEGLIHAQN